MRIIKSFCNIPLKAAEGRKEGGIRVKNLLEL
jgi:hypothetical protein